MNITKLAWLVALYAAWVSVASSDDALVRRIHELELEGRNDARATELKTGPEQSDIDARLHWLRGEILVENEWVPYRRVVDQGNRWAELHRYQEQRAKRSGSKEDQYYLADGCREHKLMDEERSHLHGVLAADPTDEEAHHRLGNAFVAGIWIRAEEARTAEQITRTNQKAFETWQKRVATQKKLMASPSRQKKAAAAIGDIQDLSALPVMEAAFANGNEQEQLLLKNWISRFFGWKASASLAKLALITESARVRVETIKELKSRRLEEFAPTLLSAMVTPIQIRIETQKYGLWTLYDQLASYESQDKRLTFHYTARFAPEALFQSPNLRSTPPRDTNDRIVNSSQTGERIMMNLARQEEFLATQRNANAAVMNDRCIRVLSETSGCAGMTKPEEWWAWWEDDQGYVIENKNQVFGQYHEEWYVSRRRGTLQRQTSLSANRFFRPSSCFGAGTPVLTEFGLKPIEVIVVGDRVLSQDVETGELAFKPVLRAPTRTSAGSAILTCGEDQIRCTPCHPFWVNGKGWRMAHELESSDQFHSLDGAVKFTSIVPAEQLEVYNLEVADFSTYFVGKSQVLTHDVTVRQPADMALPGFARQTVQ